MSYTLPMSLILGALGGLSMDIFFQWNMILGYIFGKLFQEDFTPNPLSSSIKWPTLVLNTVGINSVNGEWLCPWDWSLFEHDVMMSLQITILSVVYGHPIQHSQTKRCGKPWPIRSSTGRLYSQLCEVTRGYIWRFPRMELAQNHSVVMDDHDSGLMQEIT